MILVYSFGVMFVVFLVAALTSELIMSIGLRKNTWISFTIIGISLIASVYYFHDINNSFTTNFIKYPDKIIPTLLLLICIVSIFTFVFFVIGQANGDWLVVHGTALCIFCMLFILYPFLSSLSLIYQISEEGSKNTNVNNWGNYSIIEKQKNNNSYFTKVSMSESVCDHFILDLSSRIKDKKKNNNKAFLENKEGKKYLIGDKFYLNNKQYNENNKQCIKGNNIVYFEMIEK